MSDKNMHGLPEFLIQSLNEGSPMSEQELKDTEKAYELSGSFSYPATDADAQWNKFRAGLNIMQVTHKRKTFRYQMFRWVAAAVIVLVTSIGIYEYQKGADPGFTHSYVTANEKLNIRLPDGSNIILNKNSKLTVDAMNPYKRALTLHSGEAFFSVAHDGRPFVLSSAQGTVEVLGTEFNVRAYKNMPYLIYLKKGKVRWHNTEGSYDLRPGQELRSEDNEVNIVTAPDEQLDLAWCTNKLVFENETLTGIIQVLEAKYNVKFAYDQSLALEKFNLTIEDLSAEQAAELLAKATNSKISIQ